MIVLVGGSTSPSPVSKQNAPSAWRNHERIARAMRPQVIRDGMRIDRDIPIPMLDGVVLRSDVYRPVEDSRYPVIMTHGPYAKGLAFQVGYPGMRGPLSIKHPDVIAGSTNKYQNGETVDPEKWMPDGCACVRVDSRGAGRSPGLLDIFSPQETRDCYECVEWAGERAWSRALDS